jgi:hypothetical protein
MRDPKASIALYSVSSDLDGARIAEEMRIKSNHAMIAMLQTAKERLATDPQLVASMLQGVMFGVSRRLLESRIAEKEFALLRQETIFLVCAYLNACTRQMA